MWSENMYYCIYNVEKVVFTERYIDASNYRADKTALVEKSVTNVYKKQKKSCSYNRNPLY